ncbi:MAG: hypothetical protein ACLPH3_25150 [Terracidiphilus sp.]
MRFRVLISASLACASVPLIGQATAAPSLSADEVIARMFAHDVQRETEAGGYPGNPLYDLDNLGFDKEARLVVSVSSSPDGTKCVHVVSEQGWKSANNRVLRETLELESKLSRPRMRPKAQITPDNYAFQWITAAPLHGRLAYVIDVIPKRQDEYLFRGRIWVDAEDYALARVEGEPAKSPSFWVRGVHFTQEYRKNGAYWLPWSTNVKIEAEAFGKTEVEIHHFDYLPRSGKTERDSTLELVEVQSAPESWITFPN